MSLPLFEQPKPEAPRRYKHDRGHRIDANSRDAYHEEKPKLRGRALAVLQNIQQQGPATDRGVMRRMGFVDPNMVRPVITRLMDEGRLSKVCDVKCPETGKTVRVVGLPAGGVR